jgi:plastocyanin
MRRARLAVVLASLFVMLAAVAPPAQALVVVKASGTSFATGQFKPKSLSIAKGTTVKWRALEGSHTVTAYSRNWSKDSNLSVGNPTRFTFNRTGTFKYRCSFHSTLSNGVCSGMCAKVVVG